MKYVWDGHVLRLWDTQWMNIVNADYSQMSKEDAIHAAVKATEEKMAENSYNRIWPTLEVKSECE